MRLRFRLIDTAGSELAIDTHRAIEHPGETVHLPGCREVTVLEIYDDEAGQVSRRPASRARQRGSIGRRE